METASTKNVRMTSYTVPLIFCLLLCGSWSRAATVYFEDSFEEGLGKWTVGGDAWQQTDLVNGGGQYAVSDSPEADYPLNANSIMAMRLQYRVDLSDSEAPILSFWHQIGVEEGDYGYVEISQDNGFNWEEVASFTNTWRSTWSREMVDLSAYKASSILIRFHLRDDGEVGWSRNDNGVQVYGPLVSSGWDIDDVVISELDTETLPFPLFDDFESGTGNWVFGGWCPTESYSRSQTHAMSDSNNTDYPRSASSDLILSHPVDLSSSANPVLTFWHRIGVREGDYGYVDISEDGGYTWQALDPNHPEESEFTDLSYATWTYELFDLSRYKASPILLRFRLRDDGEIGWFYNENGVRE